MLSSPLQTSSSTMIDDRFLRAYLHQNLEESGHMEHFNLASSGNGDRFLNSSVHFPSEMRSANLNHMVSSIVDENSEYQQNSMMQSWTEHHPAWFNGGQTDQHMHYVQQMKNIPSRQMKINSSSISESGHPRNIPDSCSTHSKPPKDIPVLIRKGDHTGLNSLIKNMSLQQFRQMIGLQRSSGLPTINDRKNRNHNLNHQSSSSSSSTSSSLPTSNLRIINTFKQQDNLILQQQTYPRQQLLIHETTSMNDTNMTTNQEISYFRSNRRTGVANTLHIAIEKCYEQLNYIRDSYAETESKICIQILHKSSSSIVDVTNTNFLTLSNNPSRVDRLIAEYHYEYSRIIRLHERIREGLTVQDIEATRQTLDEWLNAINIVQDRRRQEIDNATEKCRSGEPRLPDEKDVLQLAEALRILRITTRKIRTVLWYWLYWSTNSTTSKIPLIARHEGEQQNTNQYPLYNGIYSTIMDENYKQNDDLLYSSMTNELFDVNSLTPESDDQRTISFKKKSMSSNENNKENECNK